MLGNDVKMLILYFLQEEKVKWEAGIKRGKVIFLFAHTKFITLLIT
jgi:hypothetical protein